MERKGKAVDGGKTDVFVQLRIYLYSGIFIVILSQVFFVANALMEPVVPSVLNVTSKTVFYDNFGKITASVGGYLAFGPGFEKRLKKHHQIHPNLDSNLLSDGQFERKNLNLDRMIHMTVTMHAALRNRDEELISEIENGSAADWLMVDKEDAIPFALVDQGFEVWLLNARGNEYSNRHQFYKTADPRFWNFSFHEQGIYDVPAVVTHVKKHTQTQRHSLEQDRRVGFVGSGMGTTVFYVYLSKKGEPANDNTFVFVSVTPTAFLSKTSAPLKLLAPLAFDYFPFQKDGPLYPQLLANFLHVAVPEICPFKILKNVSLCVAGGFLRGPESSLDLSTRVMTRFFGHYPATTSIRTFLHYVQLTTTPKFREFNFGYKKNFKIYKQLVPLQYNLFQASVPSTNLYGQKDLTVDFRDAERTTNEVSVTLYQFDYVVTDPYTHIDFMYGTVGVYITRFATLTSLRYRALNLCYVKQLGKLGLRDYVDQRIQTILAACCLPYATAPLSNVTACDKPVKIIADALEKFQAETEAQAQTPPEMPPAVDLIGLALANSLAEALKLAKAPPGARAPPPRPPGAAIPPAAGGGTEKLCGKEDYCGCKLGENPKSFLTRNLHHDE